VSLHVARINFTEFFRGAFTDAESVARFVAGVEQIDANESKAKIVVHQTARMLWLADRIEEVAKGRAALYIAFYLIAAEAVAKMVSGFTGEGKSRFHVRLFFREICSDLHRQRLARSFSTAPGVYLAQEEAVDLLYDVRCDVVHEGKYFNFLLPESPEEEPLIIGFEESLEAHIAALELRQIVLEGALLGAAKIVPPGKCDKEVSDFLRSAEAR
jgi:hypothetical protein